LYNMAEVGAPARLRIQADRGNFRCSGGVLVVDAAAGMLRNSRKWAARRSSAAKASDCNLVRILLHWHHTSASSLPL
jgi:hypothetical protein